MRNKLIPRTRRGLWLWLQYVSALALWAVAMTFLLFAGWRICQRFIWQPTPLWQFLNWVRQNVILVLFTAYATGWLAISYYFIARPQKHLEELVEAAQQLAHPGEEPIVLSGALKETESQLNLLRERALRDAMAAKEAEQRKNDLIVYLAHDLKTPLTSVIGYLTLLRDEPELSPALRARYTGVALDKAERLEDLINSSTTC